MDNRHIYNLLLVFLLLLISPPFNTVLAQESGESVTKRGSFNEDLYLAGGRVQVSADVDGDVVAAGGRIIIEERVTGDVMAAGGSIDIRATVLDDLRAAGGEVLISGNIAGDAIACGGRVYLSPDTRVGERAWLCGGDVEVAGKVGRELRASGGTIVISGEINGNVLLFADHVEILPAAVITGNIIYHSPHTATIDNQAQISGTITQRPLSIPSGPTPAHIAGIGITLLLSLIVAGVTLYLLFPGLTQAAANNIRNQPWASVGLGLALLFTTPIVAMLLISTIIGSLLGLVLLASYGILILAGYLTGVLFVADSGLQFANKANDHTKSRRVTAAIAAFIVVGVLELIPVLGCLIAFFLLLLGLGALALQVSRQYANS